MVFFVTLSTHGALGAMERRKKSEKPKGAAGDVPWWAQPIAPTKRRDAWGTKEKLKRPEDDLFVSREGERAPWTTFRPARRVRLRNGRPDPKQADASLFAIGQIVEETHFLAELHGSVEDLKKLAEKLAAVLEGRRWLRVGRAGAPVEVAQLAWSGAARTPKPEPKALLTLTSDLLVRDEHLRWRTALDETALKELLGVDVQLGKSLHDSVMVHGFNGTSRLWRMPAAPDVLTSRPCTTRPVSRQSRHCLASLDLLRWSACGGRARPARSAAKACTSSVVR